MTTISEQTIHLEQGDIHTLQAGPAGAPTVLLLHGMKFQAATWQDLGTLEHIAATGMRAVALDLPGFGKSPASDLSANAVLTAITAHEKLGKPILLGPSMGGRVSLEFTLDHPEMVGGLVLVGAVGVQENRERLKEIGVPCLIIWGGADAISPVDNGRLLEQEIQGAEMVVIEDAPHPCYLDQPARFHAALLAFLQKVSS